MRDPKERVRDMLEAMANIERFLGRGKTAFTGDELLQTYFVHNLQILGEAARRIPNEVRSLAPDVPWTKIVGMRNVLVHGYFDMDTEMVWDTAAHEIPTVKPFVERLLRELENSECR